MGRLKDQRVDDCFFRLSYGYVLIDRHYENFSRVACCSGRRSAAGQRSSFRCESCQTEQDQSPQKSKGAQRKTINNWTSVRRQSSGCFTRCRPPEKNRIVSQIKRKSIQTNIP